MPNQAALDFIKEHRGQLDGLIGPEVSELVRILKKGEALTQEERDKTCVTCGTIPCKPPPDEKSVICSNWSMVLP